MTTTSVPVAVVLTPTNQVEFWVVVNTVTFLMIPRGAAPGRKSHHLRGATSSCHISQNIIYILKCSRIMMLELLELRMDILITDDVILLLCKILHSLALRNLKFITILTFYSISIME